MEPCIFKNLVHFAKKLLWHSKPALKFISFLLAMQSLPVDIQTDLMVLLIFFVLNYWKKCRPQSFERQQMFVFWRTLVVEIQIPSQIFFISILRGQKIGTRQRWLNVFWKNQAVLFFVTTWWLIFFIFAQSEQQQINFAIILWRKRTCFPDIVPIGEKKVFERFTTLISLKFYSLSAVPFGFFQIIRICRFCGDVNHTPL